MRGTVGREKGFEYAIYIGNPEQDFEMIGTTKHRSEAVAVFKSAMASYQNDNIYLKEGTRIIDGHEPRGTSVKVIEPKIHEHVCMKNDPKEKAIKHYYPKLSKARLKDLVSRSEEVALEGGFKTVLVPVEWGFYARPGGTKNA